MSDDDPRMPPQSDEDTEPESKQLVAAPTASTPFGSKFQLPTARQQEAVFVLVGSCGSGKTHFLKYCMYQYAKQRHYGHGVVFTETKYTGDYRWAPAEYVRKYNQAWFVKYWQNMRNKVDAGVAEHGDGFKLKRNFVVWDDSLGMLGSSAEFLSFVATHRHTSTDIWILTQAITARDSCAKTVRLNTTYACMWPTSSLENVKTLWQNFGGMLPYNEFRDALDNCRKREYSCLVMCNSNKISSVSDQFYRALAGKFPKFELKYGKAPAEMLPEEEQQEPQQQQVAKRNPYTSKKDVLVDDDDSDRD